MATYRSALATAATVLGVVLIAAAARATTPTPSATPVPTPEPPTVMVHAHVFDASQGPQFPINGARVEYEREPSGVKGVLYADLNGELDIVFSQHDDAVAVSVSADGYLPAQFSQPPRVTDVIEVGLQPEPRTSTVTVVVSDSLYSLPEPLGGAEVQYTFFRRGGESETNTLVTDEQGTASFDLPIDVEWVAVRVSHDFYAPFLATYSGADLRTRVRFIPVELHFLSKFDRVVSGIVYDAATGPGTPLAGAAVSWERFSSVLAPASGSVRTAADGSYTFTVEMADESWLDVTADAVGFASHTASLSSLPQPDRLDFALAPLGGVIAVGPDESYFSLECAGHFDVTISNTSTIGDVLTIVDVLVHHGYSQGEYGSGFSWDLSAIDLPFQLDGGESVSFPVTYLALPGDFDSRLHVDVQSGARSGTASLVVHGQAGGPNGYPYDLSCGSPSPSPTHTPPPEGPCAGDCDGDGVVTVSELVRAVAMALGRPVIATVCPGLDRNGDAMISIDELIAAVGNALGGCAR